MKNARFRDTPYAEQLIGPETISTMLEGTIRALQDHGHAELTLCPNEANRVLQRMAEAGVAYDDVVETLKAEGVQRFVDSFIELLAGLDAKRQVLGTLMAGR